ncbi:MAG TPA: hypothetical protein P5204_11185 [Kiritimatiellia bacterium]|nr:hypothetical protein [Kiritimatiellia bacterium]
MLERDFSRKHVAIGLGGLVAAVALPLGLSAWFAAVVPPAAVPVAPAAAASAASVPPPVAPAAGRVPAAAPAAPTASAAAADRELERKAFRLEMENAKLRARLDDMLNWILDNVRGTFPLPDHQMANLRVAPVDTNLATSADLAEILRLNDEEIFRLDSAFLGTRSVLRELEAEKITVERPAEKQTVLNIPPYAEEGELVREELYVELKRTLGAGRFDRFLQIASAGLDESFDHFGAADRTLEFEEVTDVATGEPQLYVRDERVLPSKDDPRRQDVFASERLVAELPGEYVAYWNWLPEYVTRYARGAP